MFRAKYIANWEREITDNELVHVRSRRAQAILRYDIVRAVRLKEIKLDTVFPYKLRRIMNPVYQLMP